MDVLQLRIEEIWLNYRDYMKLLQNAWLSYSSTLLFSLLFAFQLDFCEVVSCNPSVGQQNSENRIQALLMKTTATTILRLKHSFSLSRCGTTQLEQKGIFRACIAHFTSCQFPMYQEHVTEEVAKNCTQNLRN